MKIDGTICGDRLYLRSYDKNEVSFVSEMWFDKENGKYLSDPTSEFIDDVFRNALDEIQDIDDGYYFVACLNSGEKIGSASAFPNEDKTEYDIGYCIHKKFWRNGYGTEMVQILLGWIQKQGAKSVSAEVAVQNKGSRRLLEKLGFVVKKETEFKKYNMDISYKSYIYRKYF